MSGPDAQYAAFLAEGRGVLHRVDIRGAVHVSRPAIHVAPGCEMQGRA